MYIVNKTNLLLSRAYERKVDEVQQVYFVAIS